jgi:hypothetical protein
MAKSQLRTIHVWQAVENLVCQHAGRVENDFAISITFGERRVIAQAVARRILASPLIKEDFRGSYHLLACDDFASANLNHQNWPRANIFYLFGE